MTRNVRPALRRTGGAALGTLAALAFGVARAQEPALDGVGAGVEGFGVGDLFNIAWRLVLVVGVIWGAVWAMRWYVQRVNGPAASAGRQVQIIETRALGPNRSLQLVRLGGRAVLLGVTAERINALLEIDDPEEVARLSEAAAAPQGRPRPVAGVVGLLGGLLSTPARLQERRRTATATQATHVEAPAVPAPARERRPVAAPRRPVQDAATSTEAAADLTPLAAQQLQARAGYGSTRAERIAELQRAITRARQESR